MFDNSLQESLLAVSILMQKHMSDLLPKNFEDSKLVEAMRYSTLSDGKRIRPFLLAATSKMFGVDIKNTLNTAAAVEFIHVYSLIHDDLPAMDDDEFRRGIPTCHKKYNEATAILAGDALLTLAFEILSDSNTHKEPIVRLEVIKTIAIAAGYKGMIGGQMMDLESAGREISNQELAKLHRLKTGELFMASAELGAILGRATKDQRAAVRNFAHDLGLAFQIKDDLLDHIGTEIGKVEIDENIHQQSKDNVSIVDVIGIDQADKRLELLKEQAIDHLKIFGDKAHLLKELVEFVITRKK